MATKSKAREHGYAARMALSAHDQAVMDAAIVKRCQDAVDWPNVRRLHVYLPLARKREIGTWALVRWLWAVHPAIEVVVPRMTKDGMEHVVVTHDSRIRPNHYQIPEPVAGRLLKPDEPVDVVITPLLAFDRQGHRVGYGGGYYDRFLAGHPKALKIGLGYDACLLEEGIIAEPHDVPMNLIITEREVLKVEQKPNL